MLKKMKWRLAGPGVTLSLALLGFVPQASAQVSDIKTYPPSMCVADATGEASYDLTYAYRTSAGSLHCPAVKDRYGATYNQTAYVNVRDTDPTNNLACYLYIRDQYGATTDWASASTSGSSGNTSLTLQADTGSASSNATFVVACHWPVGTTSLQLRSYQVVENNNWD